MTLFINLYYYYFILVLFIDLIISITVYMGHRTQSEHCGQSEPLRSSTKICIALVFEQYIDFYFIHWRYRPQWTRIAYIYWMSTERTQSIRTIWENIQYYRPRKYHTVHLVPEATSNFLKFNLLNVSASLFRGGDPI